MRTAVLLLVCAAAVHAGVASAPQFTDPQRRAKLESGFADMDRLFREFAERAHVPGAAWGIIIDGELAHTGVTGYRDVAAKAPVDADTVFRIASMTKSFTAMAILKLRDEGKLSLDDPAEKYVPEMKALAYPTTDSPRITIRHLLSHSEGFPEDNPWGDQQLADTDEQMSRDDARRHSVLERARHRLRVLELRLRHSRPHRLRASSGDAVPSGLRHATNILQPLGMTSTTLEPSKVPADRLAHGYRWEDEQWKNEPLLAERLVRLDGRHADVASAISAATSARSSTPGRRATAPRPGRSGASSLREMQQVWRPAPAARDARRRDRRGPA